MLSIAFRDMEILGGLTIFLEKQAIKSVIYFEEGKMLEVLRYALPYAPCTMRFALLSAVLDPPGIPVAGRSN
ncbi:MAG: hypothetical protein ABIL06_11890 [Pseudomonadota bacterium]